jgi:hypothetical protein
MEKMITFVAIGRTGEALVAAYLKGGLRSRNLPTRTEEIHGQNNRRSDAKRYMFTAESYIYQHCRNCKLFTINCT